MKAYAAKALALLACLVSSHSLAQRITEEILVWGEHDNSLQTQRTSPTNMLVPTDLAGVNVSTTEDLIKLAPNLVVRRRFIGDANGTLGIRGSSMFQTARAMVFADGVPLHYFLESRWNGAPRWTMVSASEVAHVEILYGPFSAEYSGNAMGGVVNIETAIPQGRELHIDGNLFSQQFDAYGFDQRVGGHKGFISYGDRIDNLSFYLSYNHLDNKSQPQSFYYGVASDSDNPASVSGAILGKDREGQDQWYFGDSGTVKSRTDNLKLKLGYDWQNWSALLNLAYEDRLSVSDSPNSYVHAADGSTLWGGHAVQNQTRFYLPPNQLNISTMQRDSLSAGLRLRGKLSERFTMEANLNHFDILKDRTRQSRLNPAHPEHTAEGQVTDYGNTGWHTAEIKLFGKLSDGVTITSGARHEAYKLNINVFESDDYRVGHRGLASSQNGGETQVDAVFIQLDWQIDTQWSTSVGGRYEDWRSRDGYFSEGSPGELEQVLLPGNNQRRFSPKFSVGFQPHPDWHWRYSAAKAHRFPIVEELFSQYQAYSTVNEANPELRPEDGTHHNLSVERFFSQGSATVNLFQESIKDVIESQLGLLPSGASVRTFIPVDRVDTYGVELITQLEGLWLNDLDLNLNIAYTHSEIARNKADPTIEGNIAPRMPKWRANLFATYHLSERWHLGSSLQYVSNNFGQLDHSDSASGVYGAQDSYRLLGVKGGYEFNRQLSVSAGVDNLTDTRRYVAHPWPGRTLYLSFAYRTM